MGCANDFQLFFAALSTELPPRRIKLEGVASDAGISAAEDHVDRAAFDVHSSVAVDIFASAAHGYQTSRLAAAHGDLEYGASGCVKGTELFLGLGEKDGPELFDGFANLVGGDAFWRGHELLPRTVCACARIS